MAGGGGGQASEGAQLGTEYTLQGVMRFLQTEWHRHERDRNAWEIERAEMKSRIGRLEGEARTSKRSSESLSKYVKILEIALRKEREKTKSLANGEKVDLQADPKEQAKEALKSLPQGALASSEPLNLDTGEPGHLGVQQDNQRDKSRGYLGKCSSEVTYHVIPSAHPPPDLADMEAQAQEYSPIQPPQRLEDAYAQQRKQQHANNASMLRDVGMLRDLPMSAAPSADDIEPEFESTGLTRQTTQINHALPIREQPDKKTNNRSSSPITAIDNRKQSFDIPPVSDEPVESISHTYDAYGKPVASREEVEASRTSEQAPPEISDGWDFDDGPTSTEPVPEQMHHRPDTDVFPSANLMPAKSPTRAGLGAHRRKSSGAKRRSSHDAAASNGQKSEGMQFKVRFALRGHLDVVRSVIFTGGGTPAEPEIATCGDDGTIKRWIIPASYGSYGNHQPGANDLDITSYFTHRGHSGAVTALASAPASQNFSNGGRALGDGWIFSGGQDATIKVWERGRVDPKASLDGHTDAVWALCVLPGTSSSVLGDRAGSYGGPDRILLASGGADGRILIWAVSAPPQLTSPHSGSNRGARASRRANSISSGSNFPSSPQPSTATSTPFHFTLVHHIVRADSPSPTCISPLSPHGDNFVVSYTDASILAYDTRSGEEVVGMASLETYDGTPSTGVNSVVASTIGFDGALSLDHTRGISEEAEGIVSGATGSRDGVEGVIISGYEDRYVRFFDANSGQCTYTMIAHTSAISSLSLSPDGRELVSAGHDASLRFWSLEKRSCTQEITSHRLMRGEGVCSVVWSQDGRWVVSGGGDGVVKVFAR